MSGPVYIRKVLTPAERFVLSDDRKSFDLSAAYAGLKQVSADQGYKWSGWKLGGTNFGTQAAFNVQKLYFGPLHETEIFDQPTVAPKLPLCQVQGEVEIALRVNADKTGYDAWCVALEMPASAVENLPGAGVEALIADRCGAGALLLGPAYDGELPDLSAAVFRIVQDGQTLSESGIETLVGTPASILSDFIGELALHGYDLNAGDWVATGGITKCCPLDLGAVVSIQRDDVEELKFTVGIE